MIITAEYIRDILYYNPKTGIFIWKKKVNSRIDIGDIAGTISNFGYCRICIKRRIYVAHRLAWLYIHDEWPSDDIDHINRDRADNRIANLRVATRSQNTANSPRRCNNKSGYKGVSWSREKRKWLATIRGHEKSLYLGYFGQARDAHLAYCAAAEKFFGKFGSGA